MMKLWLTITLACILVATTAKALAQSDAPEQTPGDSEIQSEQSPDKPEDDIGNNPVAAGSSRFEPSEEVSEDLSISFPADI